VPLRAGDRAGVIVEAGFPGGALASTRE
jgi:hypothetical protein